MGVFSLVAAGLSLANTLDQIVTNGPSLLGTVSAPILPRFLLNNPLPDGFPWSTRNCTNTNPYNQAPETGVVRNYDFVISRGILYPDGYERNLVLVNGQYPGPTIEANWGDTIVVKVTNNISSPLEGTSIHWHGFLQHQNQWMDGTPGFTQCPIAPQKSFTYKFRAELFGTTWYHAHYSSQYADGVVGPIVVYGPNEKDYDIDLGPIMLSDYYHVSSRTIVKDVVAARPGLPPPKPTSDNNLINGKMNFDCSTALNKTVRCFNNAGLSKFKFQAGRRHRLRLINSGADATQQFSIDGHTMTVIENDFVAVKPYTTDVVTLGVGQRTDVVVQGLTDPRGIYWIRSNATCTTSRQPFALAGLYYEEADLRTAPKSLALSYSAGCDNDSLGRTIPLYPIAPGAPETTYTLNMTVRQNASAVWLWQMNDSSFRADLGQPSLLQAKSGNNTFPSERNVINTGSAASYRFIVNNQSPSPHPMHFHGHNMYILAVGTGTWDGKTIVRPENPQRRDVQNVPANGYLVWQADGDNPGSWAFHCHLVWHAATGLTVDILEQPDKIKNLPIPDNTYQVCKDWKAIVATGQIELIDSGV